MTHTFTVCFYFSLLPFIAKTLERVVFNQFSLFLSQNNKLDAKQSGFRSGHSTETALLSVTEAIFVSLHWLPVAARIQFKTLMLANRTTTGSAPTYFHSLLRIYIPSRSLRSASERRLVVPSQRGSKSLSRTFSFTIPGWWNDLPTPHPESLSIFKQQLKTHLFRHYLTSS